MVLQPLPSKLVLRNPSIAAHMCLTLATPDVIPVYIIYPGQDQYRSLQHLTLVCLHSIVVDPALAWQVEVYSIVGEDFTVQYMILHNATIICIQMFTTVKMVHNSLFCSQQYL